jgi:2-keto-4-pentenoate hydratase/2-oxohepta-3-ene-1,7-dioic acid hydratase in catechol pathway
VKLVTYDRRGRRRLGALIGGRVVDLPDAVGHPAFPSTLESLIRHHGGTVLEIARESLEREDVLEFEVPEAGLLAPLLPSSIRAFRTFEDRAELSAPLYSRGEHRAVLGTDEVLAWPRFTHALDFECQWGCVVGTPARNLTASRAGRHVFGYVLMVEWVARDVEEEEAKIGVGPGKSRVATCVGPWVATADEVDPASVELAVTVDDEPWGEAVSSQMRWGFPELLAYASMDEDETEGDVLASGPFPGGSGNDAGHLPRRGATVQLEGTGLGVLRTAIGPGPTGRGAKD